MSSFFFPAFPSMNRFLTTTLSACLLLECSAAFAEGAALAAKADNAEAAALLADAEHKKRGSAPKKRRYDFDF